MIYLSEKAYDEVFEYIESRGYKVKKVREEPKLGKAVGDHADLMMCCIGGRAVFARREDFSPDYPKNAAFCALVLGKYFIHRLDITAPELMSAALSANLTAVNVRQGYTKCSAAVVSENAVITSDRGIYNAVAALPHVRVLLISPGHILLPGYETGFIGGCCGRVGEELLFNGDLSRHPDFERIKEFTEKERVRIRYFPGRELRDVGSIIEVNEN